MVYRKSILDVLHFTETTYYGPDGGSSGCAVRWKREKRKVNNVKGDESQGQKSKNYIISFTRGHQDR